MVDPLAADHNPNSAKAIAAREDAHATSYAHGQAYEEAERQGAESREVWGRQFHGQPEGSSRSVMAAVMLHFPQPTSGSASAGAGLGNRTVTVSNSSKSKALDELYRNNLKNRFLTASAFSATCCFRSCLVLGQW